MSTPENDGMLISASIDWADLMGDVKTNWAQMVQHIEKQTATLEIKPELDLAATRARVRELSREFEAVTQAIADAEKQMESFEQEAREAQEALDKLAPGFGEDLKKAAREGQTAVDALLDSMKQSIKDASKAVKAEFGKLGAEEKEHWNSAVKGKIGNEAAKFARENLERERLIPEGKKVSKGTIAGVMMNRIAKATDDVADIEKNVAQVEKMVKAGAGSQAERQLATLKKALTTAAQEAERAHFEAVELFEGDADAFEEAYHMFKDLARGGGKKGIDPKAAVQKATQMLSASERFLATLDSSGRATNLSELRSRRDTLGSTLHGLGRHYSGLKGGGSVPPAMPPGGAPPVPSDGGDGPHYNLNINIPHLIAQIEKAMDREFELRINKAFLSQQIQDASVISGAGGAVHGGMADGAIIRTLDMAMVNISHLASVAEKAADNLMKGYVPDGALEDLETRRESILAGRRKKAALDRDEQRLNMVDRLKAADVTGKDYARSREFLKEMGAGHLIPLWDKATAYKRVEPGTPDHDKATREALSVAASLRQGIHDFERSGASSENKELMKRWGASATAEFLTQLERRAKRVQEVGPNMNSIGALSGVDRINVGMREEAWKKKQAEIRKQVTDFAGFSTDFGDERFRNPFAEATRSFKEYTEARFRFENQFRAFTEAGTEEERQAAAKRLEAAKEELQYAQEMLRYRALENAGNITVDGRVMTKTSARAGANKTLRESLNKEYKAMADVRGGQSLFGFDQFSKGLFSGDRGLAKEYLKAKGLSDDMLNNEVLLLRHLEDHIGSLREQYNLQKKIDDEVEQQVKHIALADQMRKGGSSSAFGGGYGRTIRNAWGMFGLGLGASAAFQLRSGMQQQMAYEQEIAGIQGVLKGRNPADAENMSKGIAVTAAKYGANLVETAKAARMLAQSGMEANEVIRELDYTLMANKGMGMTIEQVENLQVAIRAITSENDRFNKSISWTAAVLEKVSAVEARYAVESKDLADAITVLSPVVEQFAQGMTGLTDVFDLVNGMTTVIVQQLRVTGTQAANSLKMVFSRLARPEILEKLQNKYGANLGTKDGKDLLPLDELMPALSRRYEELKTTEPLKAKQFATELSGGRNSNQIIALLENYSKVQKVAIESSYAWGSAQDRAAIAGDTMATAVGRINANFQLFIRNMTQSSYVGEGLKATLNGLANVMGGVNGGGGGLMSLLTLIGTGGAAFSVGKGLFSFLSKAKDLKSLANAGGAMVALGKAEQAGKFVKYLGGIAERGGAAGKTVNLLGGGLTALARIFTPGGVLLGGIALLAAGLGWAFGKDKYADLERYAVKLKSLEEIKVWDAPQMKQFSGAFVDTDKKAGFGFSTAQGAYQAAIDAMTSANIPAELRKPLAMTDAEMEKWLKDSPKEVQKWQRDFARVFIDQLPAAAQEGFKKIKTEQERVGKVAEMVGGTAFAANVQIANAVDQIREATLRMVTDSINGIKALDREGRKGWWATKDLTDLQAEVQVRDGRGRQVNGASTDLVSRGMEALAKLPMFSPDGLNAKGAAEQQKVIENSLREAAIAVIQRNPKAQNISNGQVLEEFFRRMEQPGSIVGELARAGTLAATNKIEAGKIRGAWLGEDAVASSARIGEVMERIGNRWAERAATDVRSNLEGKTGDLGSRTSRIFDRAYREKYGTEGGKAITGTEGSGAREALIQFKDTLLDVALAMHEALVRMKAEEKFASDYGLAYDKSDAYMQFGKNLIMQGQGYRADRMTDIARSMNEIPNIRSKWTRLNDEQVPIKDQRREELNTLIADRKKELTAFANGNLMSILSNTDGSALKEILQLLSEVDGASEASFDAFEKAMEKIGSAYVTASQRMSLAKKSAIQDTEFYRSAVEKAVAIEEASLAITAKTVDKLRVKAKGQEQMLAAELQALDVQLREKTISEEQYKLDVRRLQTNHAITQAYEARMAVVEAENALSAQTMADIEASVQPIRQLLTDPSVWENVVGWDKSWEDRAQGIKTLFIGTFGKIAQSFNERIFDNIFKKINDKLFDSALGGIMGLPETVLQESVVGAKQFESGIMRGAVAGGQVMAQMIAAAALGGSASSVTVGAQGAVFNQADPFAINPAGYANTIKDLQATKSEMDAAQAAANLAKQNKKMMYTGAGMMVGQIGGTLVGRGGQNAQMGSSIGSTVGMLGAAGLAKLGGTFGTFFGGPLGSAIGAAAGGLIGGLLGGFGDKKKNDPAQQETSRGLDAIERAQRETITAIQVQTDALLKPENRLLNLPSTFNIPNFAPNFGGSGGGGMGGTLDLNINISGNAPAELQSQIADAVQEALEENLGNLLSNQRGTRSWG